MKAIWLSWNAIYSGKFSFFPDDYQCSVKKWRPLFPGFITIITHVIVYSSITKMCRFLKIEIKLI